MRPAHSHTPGFQFSILDAIGHTPLVALDHLTAGLPGRVVVKIEGANPGGSIKDRAALQCIIEAEADGRFRPGGTVVELTSGNMGAGWRSCVA